MFDDRRDRLCYHGWLNPNGKNQLKHLDVFLLPQHREPKLAVYPKDGAMSDLPLIC